MNIEIAWQTWDRLCDQRDWMVYQASILLKMDSLAARSQDRGSVGVCSLAGKAHSDHGHTGLTYGHECEAYHVIRIVAFSSDGEA